MEDEFDYSDLPQEFLYLSSEPIRFEPVSKVTNVFFDEANKEVLSVRGGGTLGVVVKGEGQTLKFCMENRGTISSIKFSPDHFILAIQRASTTVELLNYKDGELSPLCVQECRAKGAKVLGFIWADTEDLVLVSDHAVEFFQVQREKSSIRFVKSYSQPQPSQWFVWSPECRALLLCTAVSSLNVTLQPFSFPSAGQILKLNKFQVDMTPPSSQSNSGGVSSSLSERDVCVATLYGTTRVLVLKHTTGGADLDVYSQTKDCTSFHRTHVCSVGLSGRLAMNVLDSIVTVHHQTSKTSLLFDILMESSEGSSKDGACTVLPVCGPTSIAPCALDDPPGRSLPCPLYAPTWVVFSPDVVIDARLGCLWRLRLRLEALPPTVTDKGRLADLLLRRRGSKPLLLRLVRQQVRQRKGSQLAEIFDKINGCYRSHLASVMQSQMGECVSSVVNLSSPSPASASSGTAFAVAIDQAEMYSAVLAPEMHHVQKMQQEQDQDNRDSSGLEWMVNVVLEYVRSSNANGLPTQYFLCELVITGLVRADRFFQLHQLLQYHVLPDSKPLACLLLSLVGVYAACEQLSLDMLSRLNTASDEITEVLLSHNHVIPTIRYVQSIGEASSLSARKYLSVAMASEDPLVFCATFKFFRQRNASLRGNEAFTKGEHCEEYVRHFEKLFGEKIDDS